MNKENYKISKFSDYLSKFVICIEMVALWAINIVVVCVRSVFKGLAFIVMTIGEGLETLSDKICKQSAKKQREFKQDDPFKIVI